MKITLNWLVLAGTLVVGVSSLVSVHFLHAHQMKRYATVLLDRADLSEQKGDPEGAVEALRQFLGYNPEDGGAWKRYADLIAQREEEGVPPSESVFLVQEQALRFVSGDEVLRRRCADMALALQRHGDARRHLSVLLDSVETPGDGSKPESAAHAAELMSLMARCDEAQNKPQEAEANYRKALERNPAEVETYDRLARLLRDSLRKPQEADELIDEMVQKNPTSAQAHLLRWQFQTDANREADPADLDRALELDPQDPEVLLASFQVAIEREDLSAARAALEAGRTVAPQDPRFPLGEAQLALREGKADEVEPLLRRAVEEIPAALELQYFLADTLITLGKIEGPGQAAEFLTQLRALGLAEGYVRFLEGRILMAGGKDWAQAVSKLKSARGLLAEDPGMTARCDALSAECYGQMNLLDEQLSALRRAAGTTGAGLELRAQQADALAAAGQIDEAIKAHRTLAGQRPESNLDLARLLFARTLRQPEAERRWSEIEGQLDAALKAAPASAEEIDLLRAQVLLAQGKSAEAGARLDAAIARDPKSIRPRLDQAALAMAENRTADALAILDQAEKDLGASLDLALARLEVQLSQGGDAARDALIELAGRRGSFGEEDQARLLDTLGSIALRLGDPARAYAYWTDLSALRPDNMRVLQVRVDAALAADQADEVPALIQRMRKLEGEDGVEWRRAEAAYRLNLAASGQAAEAAAVERLAGEIEARRPESWIPASLRGALAEFKGEPERAIDHYRKAVDQGCTQPGVTRQLVALLYQRQRFDEVDQVIGTMARSGAEPADLKLIRAMNALRRDDFENGLKLAREVLSDSSTSPFDLVFLGRMLVFTNRLAEAEPILQRAVKLGPTMPDAWVSLVECLMRQGRPDDAGKAIEQAVQALPAEVSDLTLGRCFDLLGDAERAENAYRSALVSRPDDVPTLRAVADFFIRSRKLDEARLLIDRMMQPPTGASPADLGWANRARGQLLMRSGDLTNVDQALALVEQNLKASPHSFDDLRSRAILLSMRTSKRAQAIQALETLRKTRLLTGDELYLLAMLYAAQKDWKNCTTLLGELADRPNRQLRDLASLIGVLIEQGDLTSAQRRLAELVKAAPDDPVTLGFELDLLRARSDRARIAARLAGYATTHPDRIGVVAEYYENTGFSAEAEAAYRAFISQAPEQSDRVVPLIAFLARQGRAADALELCGKSRSTLTPEVVGELAVAAVTSVDSPGVEQIQQVEGWIAESLRLDPSSSGLRINLAVLRSLQGRPADSEAAYRQVLGVEPDNAQALNNLAWLLAFGDPKNPEALSLIDRAIEFSGAQPALLDTRAVIRLQQGQADAALTDLQEALAGAPEVPVIYLHLARAHAALGNHEDARSAFEQAEQRGLKVETVDPLERVAYAALRRDLLP